MAVLPAEIPPQKPSASSASFCVSRFYGFGCGYVALCFSFFVFQEAKAFLLPVLSLGSGGIVPGIGGASFRRVLLEGCALAALTRIWSHNDMVRSSHEVGRSMGDMAGMCAFLQPFDQSSPGSSLLQSH